MKNRTKEEITAFIKNDLSNFNVTIHDNLVRIEVSHEYYLPAISFDFLKRLAEFFETENILLDEFELIDDYINNIYDLTIIIQG